MYDGERRLLLDRFSREAAEDYVGLWQVVNAIKHQSSLGEIDGDELRDAVIEFVRSMLREGFIAVDLTADGGAIPWKDQDAAGVAAHIERGWVELGREPTIGELAWFDKPSGLTKAENR